jgi:peroxiredoxin (alkyl hydroperoxide reductase subunit C)
MAEMKDGCVKPVKGPITPDGEQAPAVGVPMIPEVKKVQARVGGQAPDFEASAFIAGEGFKPITLSEYKGKWIVLCFYPGDFTFV